MILLCLICAAVFELALCVVAAAILYAVTLSLEIETIHTEDDDIWTHKS